jgi:hypothetical protein
VSIKIEDLVATVVPSSFDGRATEPILTSRPAHPELKLEAVVYPTICLGIAGMGTLRTLSLRRG